MDEGRECPAEIIENEEKNLITVTCKRQSAFGNGMVSVTAKMTVADKKIAILAVIDTWLLTDDRPSNQSTRQYEFLIEPEEDIRLSVEGRQVTPVEAAEVVLMKALLGLPAETNIAMVQKRGAA